MLLLCLISLVFIGLISILYLSVLVGKFYGNRALKHDVEHKLVIVSVAEKSVFALLGLLIAFSFSGAYERYESRKIHMLDEANAYDTAYHYVDFTPKQYQAELRKDIREYLSYRIQAYDHIPYFSLVAADLDHSRIIQKRIWHTLVLASEVPSKQNFEEFVIPAVNNMFELANTGINFSRLHPPPIIFVLLIGLASMGAFLIGYNAAQNNQKMPIHILSYVLLISATIFVVINLEYPRVGFIRLNYFDQTLIDVRDDMQP